MLDLSPMSPGAHPDAVQQISETVIGVSTMARLVRLTSSSALNGPIGPHPRYVWAEMSVDAASHP